MGPNINMVSGTSWPGGDPFLQRQNEPSIAVSTRNPLHLLGGANDYRTVDLPFPNTGEKAATGDAWLGVFTSYDGGATWRSTLLPGYLQDSEHTPPLWGFDAGADPTVRSGPNGLFFYSGIAFDRSTPDVLGRAKKPAHEHLAGAGGATSGVFVSRYIDNNNKENGEPIAHLETKLVASANNTFVDKPWLAVDIPRRKPGMCTIVQELSNEEVTQSVLTFNVYLAYSVFSTDRSKGNIYFARSTDCGASWSTPVKISGAYTLNQGASMVLDPRTGTVYVSWRRFASGSETNAILITRSLDGGTTFSAPEVVASINPFDQGTDLTRFRTNSYPTMTLDRKGNVFIAWSQRGVGPGGDSRIVFSRARYKSRERVTFLNDDDDDGTEIASTKDPKPTWSIPAPVANHGGRGHQLMPSMMFTAGKLQIAFIDLRDDHTWSVFTRTPNGGWLETRTESDERKTTDHVFNNQRVDDQDVDTRRHSIDIWVAQALAADNPAFASWRVSSYAAGSRPNSTTVEQMQFNPPNLSLFKSGMKAFAGDYLDVAALAYEPKGFQRWKQAKRETTGGTSFIAFTDSRDVRSPIDGDWTNYTPAKDEGTSVFDDTQTAPGCVPGQAGMRNQNIYLARVTQGLFVGSPGDAKPLGNFQRAFVVFVQNDTSVQKTFRLSIPAQPAGGIASFLQFSTLTQLDVTIGPRSSISRTVFVTSTDPKATVRVDVREVSGGNVMPVSSGGLQDTVLLNPDIMNPDIMNPDIMNPDPMNPDIMNAEVYNPDIMNPDIMNPDIMNPDIMNPDIMNPDIMNPDIMNPDIMNPDIMNPDIMNPDIMNPDIMNPDIMNLDLTNATISDIIWTMTNTGNTTTAYDVDLLLRADKQLPEDVMTQLILHKTYTTPIAKGCELMQQTQNVILTNIPSPDIIPAASYPGPNMANGSVKNATLWLAPGGSTKITLRVVDPNGKTAAASRTATALSNDVILQNDAVAAVVAAVTPIVSAQAVNTEDAANGSTTPPQDTPSASVFVFLQAPTDTPVGGLMSPPVTVFIQDDNGIPVSGASATLQLVNGGGALLHGNTAITGVNGTATFPNLWIDAVGNDYRLVAVATYNGQTLTSKTSVPFAVLPAVVTTNADSGPGSLRQAIENANRNAGHAESVSFAIPGAGVHTIALSSALPPITAPITLDATTQPGYAGTPLIRLDGGSLAGAGGLYVFASNSVVRGLAVTRFPAGGVTVEWASGVKIQDNYVGTDGNLDFGNGLSGIFLFHSSGSLVEGNVVSGNDGVGISLNNDTSNSTIRNNRVGTNAAGNAALGNLGSGISLEDTGTTLNTITENVICASSFQGVDIVSGAHHNIVVANKIGTDVNGTFAIPNAHNGVRVESGAHDNTIGGTAPADRNLIAGNGITGIVLGGASGSSGNTVQGNWIGTNAAGTAAIPNGGFGVGLSNTSGDTIGGTAPGAGNVISGNGNNGITLDIGTTGALIQGNKIGTNAAGTAALGNAGDGVGIYNGASGNTVADNIIAASTYNGVHINNNSPGNTVRHNWIGTNAGLAAGLGNGHQGVSVAGSTNTTIGGTNPGDGNVVANNGQGGIGLEFTATNTQILGNTVSGNTGNGIGVLDSQNTTITGNLIGTNATGTAAWANTAHGISVSGATTSWTTIGGSTPGVGNLISGNATNGVAITGGATLTMIWGNRIGTDAGGILPIPNLLSGVSISATNNHIGDEWPYPPEANGNVIAFNGTHGIEVLSGTQNDIASNRIFANGSLGIYLGAGANHGFDPPVITSAVYDGVHTRITGTVTAIDPLVTEVWVDFFANAACDSSGYGEGETLLGHAHLTSGMGGVFPFTNILFPTVLVGHVVTATAQDFAGGSLGDTSQFSACVTVMAAP